jgi:hypothetical protein
LSQLQHVNTSDLRAALQLACRCMGNIFDADDPVSASFMGSTVWPEVKMGFSPYHSESHGPGRHLNGMLAAQAAGIEVDEQVIRRHRATAFFSYGGVLPLPLNRQTVEGPLINFCPHNLREGFHALSALATWRHDEEAIQLAEKSVACVFDLWTPDAGWNVPRLQNQGLQFQECQGFVHGEARMLGPLVKLHRVTSSPAILELALVLADKMMTDVFVEDGSYDPQRMGTTHIHSITSCLSSLAELGSHLQDASILQRVQAFYDNGLWQLRDLIGWTPESIDQPDSDHGEANNTGDILETALILGRHGSAGAFADAERILRCHLLPSQLRDASFIEEPPNPDGIDGLHKVADRHLGAWGFPAPYGHRSLGKGRRNTSFNMDIVGGASASVAAAWRDAVTTDAAGTQVNLLFDHKSDAATVTSPYAHGGRLAVCVRRPQPLRIRIPPWAASNLRVEGPGLESPSDTSTPGWRVLGDHLLISHPVVGAGIYVHLPLIEQEVTLSPTLHRNPIRLRLRGDAPAAMDCWDADWTYFPAWS